MSVKKNIRLFTGNFFLNFYFMNTKQFFETAGDDRKV